MKKTASRLVRKSATNLAKKILGEEDPSKQVECLKNCLNCLERRKESLLTKNGQVQTHKCPNCNFPHQTHVENGPKDPDEAFALNVLNKVASNDIMCYSDGNASIIYLPSNAGGQSKRAKRPPTPEDDREKDVDITETEISAKDRNGQRRGRHSPEESPRVSPDKGSRAVSKDQRVRRKSLVERQSESPRESPDVSVDRLSANRRGAIRGETRLREGSMKSLSSGPRPSPYSDDERLKVRGSATRTLFRDSPRRTPALDDERLPRDTALSDFERHSVERRRDTQGSNPAYTDGQEISQYDQETRGEWHRRMRKEMLPTLEEFPNDRTERRSDKFSVDKRDGRKISNEFQDSPDQSIRTRSQKASEELRGDPQYRTEIQNEDPKVSPPLDERSGAHLLPDNMFTDTVDGRKRQSSISKGRNHQQGSHLDASLMGIDGNGFKNAHSDDARLNLQHDRHIIHDDFRIRDQQGVPESDSGSLKETSRTDMARQKRPDPNTPRAPGAGSVAPNKFDAGQYGRLKGSLKRSVASKESAIVRNPSDKSKSIHGGIHRKNTGHLHDRSSKEQSVPQSARHSPLTHHGQLLTNKKRSRHVFVQPTHSKDNMHRCHSLANCCGNVTVCVCCAKEDGNQHGSSSCCCDASNCCADHHAASHDNKDNLPKSPSNRCCQIQIVHHPSGTCLNDCAACKDPHYFERNDFHTHEAQMSTMCNYHNLLCEQQKLNLAEAGHHLHFLDGNHHGQVNPTAHKIREAISLPRFDFENNRIICDPRNPAMHSRLSGHRFEPSKYSMYPVDPHILNLLYKNKEKYENTDPRRMPEVFKDGLPVDPRPRTSASENRANSGPTMNNNSDRESVPVLTSDPRYDSVHNQMNNFSRDARNTPMNDSGQNLSPDSGRLSGYDPKNSLMSDSRLLHTTELRHDPNSDHSNGPDPGRRRVSNLDSQSLSAPDSEPEKGKRRFKLPKFLKRAKSGSIDLDKQRSQTPEASELRGNRESATPSAVNGVTTGGPMPVNSVATGGPMPVNGVSTGGLTQVNGVAAGGPMSVNGVGRSLNRGHSEQPSENFDHPPHQTDLYEVLRRSTNCTDANWWEKASQKSIGSRHKPPGHPNNIQEHQNFYYPNAFDQTDIDSDGPSLCGYDMFLLKHPELQPPPSVDVDANRSIEERMAEARVSFYKYLPPKYDDKYLEMITGRKIKEGSKRYSSEPRCIYPELHRGGCDPSSKKNFICSCISDKDFDCATIDGTPSNQNMSIGSPYVNSASMGETTMGPMHMSHALDHQTPEDQTASGPQFEQSQPQSPPQQYDHAKKKGFLGFFKPKESPNPYTPPTTPDGPGFMRQPAVGIPPMYDPVHQDQPTLFRAQSFAPNIPMSQPLMPIPQQENCVPPACNPKTSKYSLNKKRVKSGSDYNVTSNKATTPFQTDTSLLLPSLHIIPDYSNPQFRTDLNFSQSQLGYPDYSNSTANLALFGAPIGVPPVYVNSQFRIVDPHEQARWAQEKQNWRGET